MPFSTIIKNFLIMASTNAISLFCFLFLATSCSSHIYQNTTLVDVYIHSKLITSLNQSVYYPEDAVNHSSTSSQAHGMEQRLEFATVWEMISPTLLIITLVILTSTTFICLMIGLQYLTLRCPRSVTRILNSTPMKEHVELQYLVTS